MTIDPNEVITATAKLYEDMKVNPATPRSAYLSRQIQALAIVLTSQINDALLEIKNGQTQKFLHF